MPVREQVTHAHIHASCINWKKNGFGEHTFIQKYFDNMKSNLWNKAVFFSHTFMLRLGSVYAVLLFVIHAKVFLMGAVARCCE